MVFRVRFSSLQTMKTPFWGCILNLGGTYVTVRKLNILLQPYYCGNCLQINITLEKIKTTQATETSSDESDHKWKSKSSVWLLFSVRKGKNFSLASLLRCMKIESLFSLWFCLISYKVTLMLAWLYLLVCRSVPSLAVIYAGNYSKKTLMNKNMEMT